MHARIAAIVAAVTIALVGGIPALAQDATPAAGGAESLFAGLGLPEIAVTVTDEGYELDQSEVEAGRYLVTVTNESALPQVFAWFVQLPEGRTAADLTFADELASGTPAPDMEMGPTPEMIEGLLWLFETYTAGGPSTSTEASRQAVLNLPAGNYSVGDEDPFTQLAPAELTVTGDPAAEITGPEPEAAVTIVETGEGGVGYQFEVQGELVAGPQIVEVLNASDQPHFLEALQYPEEITIDQVMGAFMVDPAMGTPGPDMIDFEQFAPAGWAGTQSAGSTQWVVLDLAPGQTLMVCFIPDPLAGGVPHAFEGMTQLFEVAEG